MIRFRLFFTAYLTATFGFVPTLTAQEVVLYDGAAEAQGFIAGDGVAGIPGGFTFGDFTLSETTDTFTIDNNVDGDSANGLFGGVGRDTFGTFPAIDAEASTLSVTFRPTAAGANEFRVIVQDANFQFQYGLDLVNVTPLADGFVAATVFLGANDPLDENDDAIFFISDSSGNGVANTTVPDFSTITQWQIQSLFGGSDPLNIEVSRIAINDIVPEPGSLALLSGGVLALVARRSRS
ncbi:MAG: PEP-CTERM sorting domain-containing protein [Planctomycetota bacterium]